MAPSRIFMKQGLIDIDFQYRDSLSAAVIKMPKEVSHALGMVIVTSLLYIF